MNVSADAGSGTACSADNLEAGNPAGRGHDGRGQPGHLDGRRGQPRDLLSVPTCCPGLRRTESMRPSWAWRISRIANAFKQTALVTLIWILTHLATLLSTIIFKLFPLRERLLKTFSEIMIPKISYSTENSCK